MSRPFPDLGPKVKYFFNTAGTGVRGVLRRAARLSQGDPGRVADNLYRKIRKTLSPKSMPFAQAIHIEVTNACNLECVMCPRGNMDRPVGRMDRELFEKIVTQLACHRHLLEGVALMGLGEPLLHPQLEEFSQVGKQAGLPNVYTSTNAVLLDAKRAERLILKGAFERLIFSLDGATAPTFEKLRQGADFEQICGNVEGFLDERTRLGKGPDVSMQILVMDETVDEVEAFCRRWLPRLGPRDDILVKDVDTFGGQVDDRRLDPGLEPTERFACRQLWKDLSISWDGRVTVCCKDVLYKLTVGNAHETPLEELWRHRRWEALREAHEQGSFGMEPCRGCREWYV